MPDITDPYISDKINRIREHVIKEYKDAGWVVEESGNGVLIHEPYNFAADDQVDDQTNSLEQSKWGYWFEILKDTFWHFLTG